MSAELLIANFLRVASEDLEVPDCSRRPATATRSICASRLPRKIIRAVVTSEGQHAGIKHELAEIIDTIADENPLKPDLRKIEHLSQYATTYRYPVSSSRTKRIPQPPTASELSDAIDNTTVALANTTAAFKVDLKRPDTPAGTPGPVR